MRPAGEVSLAVLKAAHAIRLERAESGQGPTLAELVARSCVGYKVARNTVANLRRHGHLDIIGTRKVAGRNRPVAEYAPCNASDLFEDSGRAVLSQCIAGWQR
jgi:hypothetical protein